MVRLKISIICCQALLFLRKETLHGSKLHVYVLMKLLRSLTAGDVTSYKIKWAVDEMLANIHELDESRIGWAIRQTMKNRSIRGKFGGIHPKLGELGYTGIEVTDTGLRFIAGDGKF